VTEGPSYTPRHWIPFSLQGYGGKILTCLHSVDLGVIFRHSISSADLLNIKYTHSISLTT
jgi:hypothetical protein